jgi:glutaredoxin 3
VIANLAGVLAVVAILAGCRTRDDDPRQGAGAELPAEVRFTARERVQLEYADRAGRFVVVGTPLAVPAGARRVVRLVSAPAVDGVMRPMADRAGARDDAPVLVVDLDAPETDGSWRAAPDSRLGFERRALAALPPGRASHVALGAGAETVPMPTERVVLYGTSWCAACAHARELLRERRVVFDDRDVEREPAAAAEVVALGAAGGATIDRVPVIAIHGRFLVGFDADRLTNLLGEPL